MDKKKITVVGSSNTDMTVKTSHLPVPGETVIGGEFTKGPGGKGANQAVAASRLGAEVCLVCKVGKDSFGSEAIAHYKEEGIDTQSIILSDKPSGTALITVDDNGENCIVVAPGANGDVTVEDIRSAADAIRSAGILLMQLEIPDDAVAEAARIAREAGVMVVLNPAPASRTLSEEVFRNVDLMIPNETELELFTGRAVKDTGSVLEAVTILRDKGVRDIIVTLGSKGSVVCPEDGSITFVEARQVKAVDTTAAGDTFCAGVCVGLSEGMTLVQAARFATAASALTVQKLGAQNSLPHRKDVIL